MQLISHLSSEAAWGKLAPFGLLYGLRLGVTKAYCLRCAHEFLVAVLISVTLPIDPVTSRKKRPG